MQCQFRVTSINKREGAGNEVVTDYQLTIVSGPDSAFTVGIVNFTSSSSDVEAMLTMGSLHSVVIDG